MAYYMAQTKKIGTDTYQAICEEHGVIGTYTDDPYGDEAGDAAAAHDTEHGYDGEDGYDVNAE